MILRFKSGSEKCNCVECVACGKKSLSLSQIALVTSSSASLCLCLSLSLSLACLLLLSIFSFFILLYDFGLESLSPLLTLSPSLRLVLQKACLLSLRQLLQYFSNVRSISLDLFVSSFCRFFFFFVDDGALTTTTITNSQGRSMIQPVVHSMAKTLVQTIRCRPAGVVSIVTSCRCHTTYIAACISLDHL